MSDEINRPQTDNSLPEGVNEIESALGQAVSQALWTHKRLGNPIATWRNGDVVIVPPEEIVVPSKVSDHSEHLPEYLLILMAEYPEYRDDAIIFANIGMKINQQTSEDSHAQAVISQCHVAWETFNSIQCLIAYDYGLGAMSLCRNLFEIVIGTAFLIDNPDKLQDFVDHGKIIAYELAEEMGADQKSLQGFRQKANYDTIKKRLGHNKWHGQSVKKLAEQTGLEELYKSFYKEASSIAHGDSYVTLGHKGEWRFSKDVRSWSKYRETALDFSFMSVAILYYKTVHSLRLPLVKDIHAVMGRLAQKGLIKF